MADAKIDTVVSDGDHNYAPSLPTPADTPHQTPLRSLSPQSMGRARSESDPSAPPSLPDYDNAKTSAEPSDVVHEERISPLDPRRFTPTLHASLVSEILSLRRELENQHRALESLETVLDTTKSDNDALNSSLSKSIKEGRTLRKQMDLLESGTLSALNELSQQRDEAVASASDLKTRLEHTLKKAKSHEENAEKTEMLWNRDRDQWDNERRNMERKVHIVEGRLKVVLDQVSAANAANAAKAQKRAEALQPESKPRSHRRHKSDASSIYSTRSRSSSPASVSSQSRRRRSSDLSIRPTSGDFVSPSQQNLADELAAEVVDYDSDQSNESIDSIDSMGSIDDLEPVKSAKSKSQADNKARKILGLPVENKRAGLEARQKDVETVGETASASVGTEKVTRPPPLRVQYSDAAIQYSPPPSPAVPPMLPEKSARRSRVVVAEESIKLGNDANQGRKRVSANAASQILSDTTPRGQSPEPNKITSSSSSQTFGELPSPPWTPASPTGSQSFPSIDRARSAVTSSATQTEDVAEPQTEPSSPEAAQESLDVPVIAIHPPDEVTSHSRRTSVALPPRTKSASSQVSAADLMNTRSIAMQTEEIRTDARLSKLPPSLRASLFARAGPASPTETLQSGSLVQSPTLESFSAVIGEPESLEASASPPPIRRHSTRKEKTSERIVEKTVNAYPGNNDNGPLTSKNDSGIRRPLRSSSLFAGFEDEPQQKGPEPKVEEDPFSDDDFFNRPMVTYTLKSGKLVSKASNPRLEDMPVAAEAAREPETESEFDFEDEYSAASRRMEVNGLRKAGKQPMIRKSSSKMLSNHESIPEHSALQQTRPRSPSMPDLPSSSIFAAARPPYPVPTRHSSRNHPLTGSERSMSPSRSYGHGRHMASQRQAVGRPGMRKSRSAAGLAEQYAGEQRRSDSPATSQSSGFPGSPDVPSLPFSDYSSIRARQFGRRGQRSDYSASAYTHSREQSSVGSVQSTTVVDAIAQTMVGEWMFKYIGRRKSFGRETVSWDNSKSAEEVSANITNNSVRHKRWVWLAPYERAIMWSSKQPTSGSALLGKTGRKLVIHSVLDVKDDTPMPKGMDTWMNYGRSILILTPQRALKFTALTQERHYVWLTALSFLSHSSIGPEDLSAIPPAPRDPAFAQGSFVAPRNGKRPSMNPIRAFTTGAISNRAIPEIEHRQQPPDLDEAAEPPAVPRYSAHSRKRSHTGPRIPPAPFRNFSNTLVSPTFSTHTAPSETHTMSSVGAPPSSKFSTAKSVGSSRRTSEASGRSSNNTLDPTGTVRMEAFVAPPEQRPRGSYRTKQGWKKDKNYWTGGSGPDLDFHERQERLTGAVRNDDPFKGF